MEKPHDQIVAINPMHNVWKRLTPLAQDIAKKSHLIVDIMVRHIKQKELAPERTTLGVCLVERECVYKK